ncbi:hypothetical protein [Mesorhizobium sp. B2-8-9]|uniref:hypothetical protein n=1 Tax=Mesorhizobium sp. B2-8-9 TaxID=2589899 RepID=UPI00112B4816|nr:hypothetical protein [Mesorhizobium sp. B2-8-9]TPI79515.1 hypothetical protein FJ423_15065 [Mesorhizobium sp. B2-8-9]
MRPAARLALAKRLDKIAPDRDRQYPLARLNRDEQAFLDAFNMTLAIIADPARRYAYCLTSDGAHLVARLFKITTTASIAERIVPTDAPEIAQAKWHDWIA